MKVMYYKFLFLCFLTGYLGALSSCTVLACIDCKPELQESWLRTRNSYIGQSMYSQHWQRLNASDKLIGSKILSNGNVENEYENFFVRTCHYFYEYEPRSGLIVKFRFEEDSKYACRASGA